jgi:hypothetical protein
LITYRECEKLLDTYTLEEIFELNDLTEVEVLEFLLEEEFVEIPNPKPVDLIDD